MTSLVVAHQYLNADGEFLRAATLWQETLEIMLRSDTVISAPAFYVPFATVVAFKRSWRTRLAWLSIAVLLCALPFGAWNDSSKEIIVDIDILIINIIVLPVAAMATYIVLAVRAAWTTYRQRAR